MTRPDRRQILAGLGMGLVAGCAPGQGDLADGKRPPAEGGIGGTGIVGVVTALGSIKVGGQRVLLPADAELSDAFGAIGPSAIQPGHSVTAEVATVDGSLVARRVRLTHPLIGPLVRRDGAFQVLGVQIVPEPGVNVQAVPRVAVSGLWWGDRVIASRIDPVAESTPAAIAGERPLDGAQAIGPLTVAFPAEEAIEPGSFATVIGRETPRGLFATQIEPGRFFGSAGPLEQLLIEGYLDPVSKAPGFAVAGLGHSFDPASRLDELATGRALFTGPYTGLFAVSHGLPLPEDPARRQQVLDGAGSPGTDPAFVPTR
ncbi:MAG: hypothetical protein AAFR79_01555 [Pseudomonadota bacterium]